MKKKLLLILLTIPLFIFFSCGKSSHSGSSNLRQDNQPIAYYVVTDVITPSNHILSYANEINDIYNQNNNYNLIMVEFAGSYKVSISCISQKCLFLSKDDLESIEKYSFTKLLNKLNYPDKITNVADENGYRYNAFKLSDETDINKFRKIIYKKS